MWRRQHDLIRRCTCDVRDGLMNTRLQVRAGGSLNFSCFGKHYDSLGPRAFIAHAKDRYPTLPDAGDRSHHLLDLLRVEMASCADDDVLDAASDVGVASGHISAVATVQPTVVNELASFRLVAEIAARGRRTAKLKSSFLPVAKFVACVVNNADFVARERLPASDELQRFRVIWRGRRWAAIAAQRGPVDTG